MDPTKVKHVECGKVYSVFPFGGRFSLILVLWRHLGCDLPQIPPSTLTQKLFGSQAAHCLRCITVFAKIVRYSTWWSSFVRLNSEKNGAPDISISMEHSNMILDNIRHSCLFCCCFAVSSGLPMSTNPGWWCLCSKSFGAVMLLTNRYTSTRILESLQLLPPEWFPSCGVFICWVPPAAIKKMNGTGPSCGWVFCQQVAR